MPNDKQKIAVIRTGSQYAIALQLIKDHKLVRGEANSSEKLATLGKILSNYKRDSAEGIISYLPLLPEEKKLLRQRNIQMNSDDRIVVDDKNKTFYINYLNQKYDLSKKAVLSKETKHALIQDLDKFYYIPLKTSTCHNFIFDLNITRRELTRLKDDQFLKVNELIAQLTDDATIAITNKYQLLENHTVSEEKLEAIANEVMDLNLDEEMKRAVIAKLELLKEDRATLRKIYRKKQDTLKTQESKTDANLKEITNLVMRIEEKEALRDIIRERAKQQTDKKQENEADIKINGKTIAEVVDDNALLLSRAMNTALALKEN